MPSNDVLLGICDSFKGTLDQQDAAAALASAGWQAVAASDGGEGFISALLAASECAECDQSGLDADTVGFLAHFRGACEQVALTLPNALGEALNTGKYLAYKNAAIIELAEHCGIAQLGERRDILAASSASFGLACAHAINAGAQRLLLAIGGSASNDCGMGVLSAFGWEFYDEFNQPLQPSAQALLRVKRAKAGWHFAMLDAAAKAPASSPASAQPSPAQPSAPSLAGVSLLIASDVQAPLCGELGCAHIFAAQKGANAQFIELLDTAALEFISIIVQAICEQFPPSAQRERIHEQVRALAASAGAGAAGGVGFALLLLGARLASGFAIFRALAVPKPRCELLCATEGCFDAQSLMGKCSGQTLLRAKQLQIPGVIIAGCAELDAPSASRLLGGAELCVLALCDVFSHLSRQQIMQNTQQLLRACALGVRLFWLLKDAWAGAVRELAGEDAMLNFVRAFCHPEPNRYSAENVYFIGISEAYGARIYNAAEYLFAPQPPHRALEIAAAALIYDARTASALDAAASRICGVQLRSEAQGAGLYIDSIATSRKHRRRGHMRRLLEHAKALASSHGNRLSLIAAQPEIYAPFGFVRCDLPPFILGAKAHYYCEFCPRG